MSQVPTMSKQTMHGCSFGIRGKNSPWASHVGSQPDELSADPQSQI
jgi:hypothetical protein